jgi:hypothetical protein
MVIQVVNKTPFEGIESLVKGIIETRNYLIGNIESEVVVTTNGQSPARAQATMRAFSRVTKQTGEIVITFDPQSAWVFSIRHCDT